MASFTQPIGLTINLANAGFVAGTTSTYTTTVTTAFSINGKFGTTLAAQTNTASPTLDANTGVAFPAITANNCACLVWGTNLAGTIALCQGPSVATAVGVTTTVGAFIAAPQFPSLPEDFCPMAYQIVRVSPTGSSFTTGVTNWTASGITCTVMKNISTLPDRPQIA
jgi:hypothetical protein